MNKRQSSLQQWVSLLMDEKVCNLKQVQNIDFMRKILSKIDSQYNWDKSQNFQEIMGLIQLYFKQEIGTDVHLIIANIHLQGDYIQILQLLMGIAIKGKNRDKFINIILQMDNATQMELMGFISTIISKFGPSPSIIQNQSDQDGDIIMPVNQTLKSKSEVHQQFLKLGQLMDQNQQLHEKIQVLTQELSTVSNNNKYLSQKIQDYQKDILNLFQNFETLELQSKNANYNTITHNSSLRQFGIDILNIISQFKKQIFKITEQFKIIEEMNHDLKHLNNKISEQNQFYKLQMTSNKHLLFQVQQLRIQNTKLIKIQVELNKKIAILEEQKYYLKKTISRNNNLCSNDYHQKYIYNKDLNFQENQGSSNSIPNGQTTINNFDFENKFTQQQKKSNKYISVDIGQIKPSLQKTNLQKELMHLREKVQQLQNKNYSLEKVNRVFQQSIEDFMSQNQEIILNWDNIYEELKNRVKNNVQQNKNNESKTDIMLAFKDIIDTYQNKQLGYQKILSQLKTRNSYLEFQYESNLIQNKINKTQVAMQEKQDKQFKTQESALQLQNFQPKRVQIHILQNKPDVNMDDFKQLEENELSIQQFQQRRKLQKMAFKSNLYSQVGSFILNNINEGEEHIEPEQYIKSNAKLQNQIHQQLGSLQNEQLIKVLPQKLDKMTKFHKKQITGLQLINLQQKEKKSDAILVEMKNMVQQQQIVRESQIVQLRILNQSLKSIINVLLFQKQRTINQLKTISKSNNNSLNGILQLLQSLQEVKSNEVSNLLGKTFDEIENVHLYQQLELKYISQCQKVQKLQIELNTLTSVLLQYRNMLLF